MTIMLRLMMKSPLMLIIFRGDHDDIGWLGSEVQLQLLFFLLRQRCE